LRKHASSSRGETAEPGPRIGGCDTAAVTSRIVPIGRILEARIALEGHVKRTPILGSQTAASLLAAAGGPRLADDRLYVKAEHLQKTGSFKPRAALTKVVTLDVRQREVGLVTLSAGIAGLA
jgi:threonine dehydratase